MITKNKNEFTEKIEQIRIKHPLYEEMEDKWRFYLSAYEGGDSFITPENISKHARETEEDYRDRCRRVHNTNYCDLLVQFFTSFIYNEPIQRDGGDDREFYDEFLKDVTLRKEDITRFMPRASNELQVFGTIYGLVDAPRSTGLEIVTKADEKSLNIRPYWILVSPLEVIDWDKDDFDQFTYFKRRVLKTERNNETGKRVNLEIYTEYFKDVIIVSKVDVTDPANPLWLGSENFPNELGKIPVASAYFQRSRQHDLGTSFLVDLAGNQKEILNLTSVLQEFLYKQAFNILAKETDGNVPLNSENSDVIGTSNTIEVPKGANFPKYISPPVDPAEFLQRERERVKLEMFLRAAQDAAAEAVSGQPSSGFSQAQSFFKTVPFITRRADILEGFETDLMSLTMEYIGKTWNGKIKYKDRYEITAFNDSITQLMMLAKDLALPSKTFVIAQFKRLVREFDPKMIIDDVVAIDKEISSMDFEDWQEDLFGVKSGKSPAEQQKPKSTNTLEEYKDESKVDDTPAASNKLKG